MDLSLNRINPLMKALDNPQDLVESVHITGTNGKGSTANYIVEYLYSESKTIGRFNSPFLHHPRDSIRIGKTIMTLKEYNSIMERLIKMDEWNCTQFELLTACAFLYFYEKKVDLCIIEVGMGGLLDATNIITHPVLCLFTPISLDHQAFLGSTIEEIAIQKSGIIKPNTFVIISSNQSESVIDILLMKCKHTQSDFSIVQSDLSIPSNQNKDVAFEACKYIQTKLGFQINPNPTRLTWPGRLEHIKLDSKHGTINFLIDGAHNPSASQYLSSYLENLLKSFQYEFHFIIAMTKGRDPNSFINPLKSLVHSVRLCEFENVIDMPWISCIPLNQLELELNLGVCLKYKHVSGVLKELEWNGERVQKDGIKGGKLFIVTGSLYFVSSFYREIGYQIE